jgi:hypothetical protein
MLFLYLLKANYELRVIRKSHLRDHPIRKFRRNLEIFLNLEFLVLSQLALGLILRITGKYLNSF